MASPKTRSLPSAHGAKPARRRKTPLSADNPKPAGKGPKTAKTAKTSNQETPPAQAAAPTPKKLSALNAAAQLLAETGQAMSCAALIEALAANGAWISPKGKTPAATLAAAILREIKTKGTSARFKKTGPGTFAHVSPADDTLPTRRLEP